MTNPKHTDTSRSGDLVERLRERTCVVFNSPGVHPDTECLEAADRIEALEAENARLREALGEISRRTGLLIHQNTGRWDMRLEHDKRTVGVLTVNQGIARAALKEIEGD